MPNAGKLTTPIMRGSASFHRNSARRLCCKELQCTSPAQSLPKDNSATIIRSVHLKHLLSQIQTNRANLLHGRLRSGDLNAPPWHIDAVAGARPPHHYPMREISSYLFSSSILTGSVMRKKPAPCSLRHVIISHISSFKRAKKICFRRQQFSR